MKIAAIDIGTNSIHMVIVQVEEHRIFEIIDREKEMVFLGMKSLLRGRLTAEAMDRGLAALKSFKSIADSHHVDQTIATATSAVREASNGREFVRRIKAETGIQVNILSGQEEARMITLAVRDVIDLKNRRGLIIDIGGGSMELIVADARHTYHEASLKAGVIRLNERFLKHDPPSSKEIKKLRVWLGAKLERISTRVQNLSPEVFIGTSGTILAFGQMAAQIRKGSRSRLETDVLNIEEVEELNEKLKKMSVSEREEFPGLDKKRAEQIIAGGILLEMVMEKCRVNDLILCDRALREGLIADYLIRRSPSLSRGVQARELRSKSVFNLLNRWSIDRQHAEHTSRLSIQLFEATARFHGFGPDVRELLEYAALLHDIGRVISYPGHHRHGSYIVSHANLLGFSKTEIDLICGVITYHRTKKPKRKDTYLRNLGKKNRNLVKLLSGILRVADALDREHNQVIQRLRVEAVSKRKLTVSVLARESVLLPLRFAVERSGLLQELLKLKKMEFIVEVATPAPTLIAL